jgi:hypothetical protein
MSAQLLAQPNYDDNTCPPGFSNDNSETICVLLTSLTFRLPRSARIVSSAEERDPSYLPPRKPFQCHFIFACLYEFILAVAPLHLLQPLSINSDGPLVHHSLLTLCNRFGSSFLAMDSSSSSCSVLSYESESTRETTPEFDPMEAYEAHAPLHWDLEE